jgi:RNA polymerase sigma factor (sigma-70 family)
MELEALVRAAQAGDREAFGALVRRFQDLAVATAWTWLRDAERARDAAQDAFLDAFLHLTQLREAAAFPGWLKRIVRKHCDRQTRGTAERYPATSSEPGDPPPDAARALAAAEDRAWLRHAIEGLPDSLRLVVALHYLGGEPQDAVAAFLELPPTTVKKRLHDARALLRQRSLAAMSESDPTLRVSGNRHFEASVAIFLAIRAGDAAAVRALLAGDPSLANATESWDLADSLARELPVATRATPLIRAAERGDLALIDLLVERGAALDGPCACAGHETPLWAALANGQSQAAGRLLELGADPEGRGFVGHTPLHVAAIRGLEEAVGALLAHGADPAVVSEAGETPLDWALRKGHHGIAARLSAASPAIRARASEITPALAGSAAARSLAEPLAFETGIKALDLLAPLRRGDLVLWHGGAGVGRNVLLGELALRAQNTPGTRNLWALWQRFAWEEGELDAFLAEMGLANAFGVLRTREGDDGESWHGLAQHAAAAAGELLAAGSEHVVLALFRRAGASADLDAALPRLGRNAGGVVTRFLIAPIADAMERPAPKLAPPLDAVLGFDPARARAQLFPALDPLSTCSRSLDDPRFDARHRQVAEQARAHLAELRAFDPALVARPLDAAPNRVRLERARRLEHFLSQPFHTTEAFNGRPGTHVPIRRTVEDAEAILGGACDALAPEALSYRGGLGQ